MDRNVAMDMLRDKNKLGGLRLDVREKEERSIDSPFERWEIKKQKTEICSVMETKHGRKGTIEPPWMDL